MAYWLKLDKMNDDRLPREVYRMLFDLEKKKNDNWVFNIIIK